MSDTYNQPTSQGEDETRAMESAIADMQAQMSRNFRRTLLLTLVAGMTFSGIGVTVGTLPAVRERIEPVLMAAGLIPQVSMEDTLGLYASGNMVPEGGGEQGFARMELEREVDSLRSELTSVRNEVERARDQLAAARRFDGTIHVDGRDYRVLGTSRPGQPHVFRFEQVSDFLQRNPDTLVVIVSERRVSP